MSIPPDLWQWARPVFEAAVDLPPEERSAYIDRVCGHDAVLRAAVMRLLDADQDDTPLPGRVTAHAAELFGADPPESAIGSRIGPYKLVRLIGTGGMGAVYFAKRDDGEFEQDVAIKLMRSGPLASAAVDRFRRERQILAWLNHPNIARLLDGGVAADEPYLVMEYVEGLPLDAYCRERQRDVEDRVRLFLSVCDALTYAHRHLVVHRDLKPGNILVTGEGVVKVLDFGIANLVDDESGDAPVGGVPAPLTRAYASPEQLRGDPLSTASDVYSLGVVLYELATGELPGDGRVPAPELTGDLDAILRRALAADPADRYPSAAAVGDDLRRMLARRPVAARPATIGYRARQFVRRHAIGVSATAVIVISSAAGIVGTVYQGGRAQRRFENVRALSNALLFDLHEAVRLLPGATEARKLLVSNALTYLDELRQDAPSDAGLLLDLAAAYERVAEVQGNPHRTNLGDLDGALKSYDQALALRTEALRRDPGSAAARQALARSYGDLAVATSWAGRNGEAIDLTRQAIDTIAPLQKAAPTPDVTEELGRFESELGWWLVWAGQVEQGLAQVDAGIGHMRPNVRVDDPDAGPGIDLWRAYSYRVDGLRFTDRHAEALALLEEQGLPHLRALEQVHPTHPDVQYELAVAFDLIGGLQSKLGRRADATEAFRSSLKVAAAMVEADSANQKALEILASANRSLGAVLAGAGQTDEALSVLRDAVQTFAAMWDRNPTNAELPNMLGNSHRRLCEILQAAGRVPAALDSCLAGEQVLEQAVKANERNPVVRGNLGSAYVHTARVYRQLAAGAGGDDARRLLDAARRRYEDALALFRDVAEHDAVLEIDLDAIEAELAEVRK